MSQNLFSNFLRLFFRLLYRQLAWSYDFVAWVVSVGMWRGWVLSVLDFIPPGPLLEVGFGTGHLQVSLAENKYFAIGIDASRQMGSISQSRLTKKHLPIRLAFAAVPYLPFPDTSFSSIVATFPAEYMLQQETWEEFFRILSPGGQVICLTAAWITGRNIFHRLAAGLFRATHQVPSTEASSIPELPAWLDNMGFTSRVIHLKKPNSVLLLIVTTKK